MEQQRHAALGEFHMRLANLLIEFDGLPTADIGLLATAISDNWPHREIAGRLAWALSMPIEADSAFCDEDTNSEARYELIRLASSSNNAAALAAATAALKALDEPVKENGMASQTA